MELDNLKNSWNNVTIDLNQSEFDIVSATKKEMKTPLSGLKKISQKQTKTLPIVFAFLVIMTNAVPEMKEHLLVWMAFIILPLITLYYYFNIRLINELEQVNGSVKNDLKYKVERLIKGNNLYLNTCRIILVALVVATEILLQHNINLMPWLAVLKNTILPLRLLIYAGIIGMHYLISRYTFNQYFGKYLNRLRDLLNDM